MEVTYQVLKSSWGISICMGAWGTIVNDVLLDSADVVVAESGVSVRNKSGIVLTDNENSFFIKAVNRIEPIAREILGDKRIVIDITKLDFSHCDYQEEGVYAVFIKWFTRFFELQEIEVPATYDRCSNRYVFQIG
ncbi:hypothetical protein [Hymenobacter yonginensis]|uniref:Uncharacterized protein n=1 Tax=Hymenobacter yonginensis TaxID=748197 RepID=A0ABY7PMF5_9BACT|nr:hypothetical protein [Hymenobacter yonginensis]WBO84392.1 hypothetical protein O9Z63_18740 [Hymenobacter yonginensis]